MMGTRTRKARPKAITLRLTIEHDVGDRHEMCSASFPLDQPAGGPRQLGVDIDGVVPEPVARLACMALQAMERGLRVSAGQPAGPLGVEEVAVSHDGRFMPPSSLHYSGRL